ncbi:MAG: protein phosphatase CheZ [candidate division Zixibacteria bacterium]|nr:protein phosphatase CheZ [candidate division Zixibacteria bacterium]
MAISEKLYQKMQSEVVALASSITEVVDKFRQLQNPLAESRETVPRATEQLDKISEQTEAAAHQMLDKVEGISQREEEVIQGLKAIKVKVVDGDLGDFAPSVDALIKKVQTNYEDAFLIMDALQFQDITAQQMNHAASLLESLETRLNSIVSVIQGSNDVAEATVEHKERVFDPNAEFTNTKTTQADIDSLFSGK